MEKCVERRVAKAQARQQCAQKLAKVGAKLRQDGSAKRNRSESSDSCSSEEKENVSSPTGDLPRCEGQQNILHGAVAFEVPFGPPNNCKKSLPKRLCNQANTSRTISIESLKEKQRMAETRKKQQEEARLKRIKERQEAARKLAENVEVLLQQRNLSAGQAQRMSTSDVMATAEKISRQFYLLTNQMNKDFSVEVKKSKTKMQKNSRSQAKTSSTEDHNINSYKSSTNFNVTRCVPSSVAFDINLDPDKVTTASAPKKLLSPCKAKKGGRLTAQDVEDKLRKAEERRLIRRQEKVRRVRASREAVFQLSSKIETLIKHQDAAPDGQQLSRQQIASLANEIADGFDRLSERYRNDLKRAENFPTMSVYMP